MATLRLKILNQSSATKPAAASQPAWARHDFSQALENQKSLTDLIDEVSEKPEPIQADYQVETLSITPMEQSFFIQAGQEKKILQAGDIIQFHGQFLLVEIEAEPIVDDSALQDDSTSYMKQLPVEDIWGAVSPLVARHKIIADPFNAKTQQSTIADQHQVSLDSPLSLPMQAQVDAEPSKRAFGDFYADSPNLNLIPSVANLNEGNILRDLGINGDAASLTSLAPNPHAGNYYEQSPLDMIDEFLNSEFEQLSQLEKPSAMPATAFNTPSPQQFLQATENKDATLLTRLKTVGKKSKDF